MSLGLVDRVLVLERDILVRDLACLDTAKPVASEDYCPGVAVEVEVDEVIVEGVEIAEKHAVYSWDIPVETAEAEMVATSVFVAEQTHTDFLLGQECLFP